MLFQDKINLICNCFTYAFFWQLFLKSAEASKADLWSYGWFQLNFVSLGTLWMHFLLLSVATFLLK